jgi:hypothetical protein
MEPDHVAQLGNVLHQLAVHPCDGEPSRSWLSPRKQVRQLQVGIGQLSQSAAPRISEPLESRMRRGQDWRASAAAFSQRRPAPRSRCPGGAPAPATTIDLDADEQRSTIGEERRAAIVRHHRPAPRCLHRATLAAVDPIQRAAALVVDSEHVDLFVTDSVHDDLRGIHAKPTVRSRTQPAASTRTGVPVCWAISPHDWWPSEASDRPAHRPGLRSRVAPRPPQPSPTGGAGRGASRGSASLSNLRHQVIPGIRLHRSRIDLGGSPGSLVRPDAAEFRRILLDRTIIEAVEEIDDQSGAIRLGKREQL